MALVIDNIFSIGDIVYLKTDTEQIPRMVYCFMVYRNEIIYKLCAGTTMSEHYDFEISPEKSYAVNA
jgi:hypothetical protein